MIASKTLTFTDDSECDIKEPENLKGGVLKPLKQVHLVPKNIKLMKVIFMKYRHSLYTLTKFSYYGSVIEICHLIQIYRVLDQCPNLIEVDVDERAYKNSDNLNRNSIYLMYLLRLCKKKKLLQKPLNVRIVDLYDSSLDMAPNQIMKTGYLASLIMRECKKYFFTYTNRTTNTMFMHLFLTSADFISRKGKRNSPQIFLGSDFQIPFNKYTTYTKLSPFIRLHMYPNL